MPRLISSALFTTRRDTRRLLAISPWISLLLIVLGVAWLFLLPLDEYSRRTYISENALLPGQVHTYFGGSDSNVFRAYRHEITALENSTNVEVNDKLEEIFKGMGLKVGRQNYTYHSSGNTFAGENIYAILQAPRGDATEAIVLVAAWKNVKGEFNRSALSLALALTRYFKRWSLWSKDIILVVPPDSRTGPQAWVDAYHDSHDASKVASLPLKSGALQGAVAIDYPWEGRFESVHIVYDGINGQLPNLDLINSVVNIAGGQMGIGSTIQEMWHHNDKYPDRLRTMLRGMVSQGLGHAAGPHSSFIPYHVDAITIQPIGQGWHDEMGLGRLIEGTFRSLNNLLEKLHQSFFFYLLMQKERFVSIGTYLPSAMLVAVNFTITAIYLWIKSGYIEDVSKGSTAVNATSSGSPKAIGEKKETEAKADEEARSATIERDLFLPLTFVTACQFLGFIPLFIFNYAPSSLLSPLFRIFTFFSTLLPLGLSYLLTTTYRLSAQQYQLFSSFSLLLLGMFLSALATLNFSLAFLVGLLASPLSFARPLAYVDASWTQPFNNLSAKAMFALLTLLSPPVVVDVGAQVAGVQLDYVLAEAAFGWGVWGMYTPLVVWCVWWPAWVVGCVVVLGRPRGKEKTT